VSNGPCCQNHFAVRAKLHLLPSILNHYALRSLSGKENPADFQFAINVRLDRLPARSR
jgi:hypothetical protein